MENQDTNSRITISDYVAAPEDQVYAAYHAVRQIFQANGFKATDKGSIIHEPCYKLAFLGQFYLFTIHNDGDDCVRADHAYDLYLTASNLNSGDKTNIYLDKFTLFDVSYIYSLMTAVSAMNLGGIPRNLELGNPVLEFYPGGVKLKREVPKIYVDLANAYGLDVSNADVLKALTVLDTAGLSLATKAKTYDTLRVQDASGDSDWMMTSNEHLSEAMHDAKQDLSHEMALRVFTHDENMATQWAYNAKYWRLDSLAKSLDASVPCGDLCLGLYAEDLTDSHGYVIPEVGMAAKLHLFTFDQKILKDADMTPEKADIKLHTILMWSDEEILEQLVAQVVFGPVVDCNSVSGILLKASLTPAGKILRAAYKAAAKNL